MRYFLLGVVLIGGASSLMSCNKYGAYYYIVNKTTGLKSQVNHCVGEYLPGFIRVNHAGELNVADFQYFPVDKYRCEKIVEGE